MRKLEAQNYDTGEGWLIVDEFDNEVAQVFCSGIPEETKATALAFGASLDLLAALENLMSVTDEKHPRWVEAQAAINKAKGRV